MAVAVTVGSNGFIVDMNPASLTKFTKVTGIDESDLANLAAWPHDVV